MHIARAITVPLFARRALAPSLTAARARVLCAVVTGIAERACASNALNYHLKLDNLKPHSRTFATSTKKSKPLSAKAAAQVSIALQRDAQEHFDTAIEAEFGGRLAEAEAAALKCLELRRRAFQDSDNHDHVVEALTLIGNVYIAAHQADAAVPYLERAAHAALVVHGEQNADNQIPALTALALALQLCSKPDLARAEELLMRASAITDRRFANKSSAVAALPDHPQRARRQTELGVLRRSQARFDEAAALFQAAIEMRRRCYGDDADYFAAVAREHSILPNASADAAAPAADDDLPHPDMCQSYGHIGMHLFAHQQHQANVLDPDAAAKAARERAAAPSTPPSPSASDADDASTPLGAAIAALYRAVHLQHVHARVHQMRPNFAVHEALAAALTRVVRHV